MKFKLLLLLMLCGFVFDGAFAEEKTIQGVEFVEVPAGTFQMGDLWGDSRERERPVHPVELDGFYMGKYEITNAQYANFLNEYGSDMIKDGEYKWSTMINDHEWGLAEVGDNFWLPYNGYENHPVIRVTWYGAYEFCRYYGFRLPTEAEWEYAARSGGQNEKWSGTSDESQLIDYAWVRETSNEQTHAVGQKKPNGLGLYDMSGNVWEWCQDQYHEDYYQRCIDDSLQKNPINTENSGENVLRGGSWLEFAKTCRTTYRWMSHPDERYSTNHGFRVVFDSTKNENN